VKAPTSEELNRLVHIIAKRVGSFPERQGLLEGRSRRSTFFQLAEQTLQGGPKVKINGRTGVVVKGRAMVQNDKNKGSPVHTSTGSARTV